ncbi:nucleotide exchange factor GrpE [Pseudonocardia acidicola]|uniref:Protein GrpE n=1 Tax=Pseudonocardia acidicola TaxID=2724939 RepID=A0ABX1SE32_9PSEU|nr:nucleotide exchange factor GrpE [Pseudonocardia acidicola]NMH99800.1 nucleotide exchange factor GrpE [Pseudonocardia acidicola]
MTEQLPEQSSGTPRHPAQSESDRQETVRQAPEQQGPEREQPHAGVVADPGPAAAPVDRAGEPATPADRPDAAELEDRWRRAAADLDNMRKRFTREVGRERAAERARVAAAFLPVLDTIDLALEHAGADPKSIIEGIRGVRDQAVAILARLGYSRQDEAGVPFDPARHEVVGVVEPDAAGAPPGAVVTVVRPGYGAPEQQLRPAAVTVAQSSG